MPSKKFYAIKKGEKDGLEIFNLIVDNWEECKKMVVGVRGSVYKSFSSKMEAQNYLGISTECLLSKEIDFSIEKENKAMINEVEEIATKEVEEITIYCDGSYRNDKGGWGVVMVKGDDTILEMSGSVEMFLKTQELPPKITNNVTELVAMFHSHYLSFIYDVKVIRSDSKFVIGALTGNKIKENKELIELILKHRKLIVNPPEVKHVKAHVGIKFNEKADRLANLHTVK